MKNVSLAPFVRTRSHLAQASQHSQDIPSPLLRASHHRWRCSYTRHTVTFTPCVPPPVTLLRYLHVADINPVLVQYARHPSWMPRWHTLIFLAWTAHDWDPLQILHKYGNKQDTCPSTLCRIMERDAFHACQDGMLWYFQPHWHRTGLQAFQSLPVNQRRQAHDYQATYPSGLRVNFSKAKVAEFYRHKAEWAINLCSRHIWLQAHGHSVYDSSRFSSKESDFWQSSRSFFRSYFVLPNSAVAHPDLPGRTNANKSSSTRRENLRQ